MNIAIYSRPWNKEFYKNMAMNLGDKVIDISDFKGKCDYWIGENLYKDKIKDVQILDEKEFYDIYKRCRFLRSLDKNIAFDLIRKSCNYINFIFEKEDIEIVIAPIIDCYTLDVLERVSRRFNIKFISFVNHFFNGYMRFTVRGELIKIRDKVSNEEIESVYNDVINIDYKPAFSLNEEKAYNEQIKFYYREVIKKYYFNFLKHISNDKYNYHYNTLNFVGKGRRDVCDKSIDMYFDKEIRLKDNMLYIPLHFSPEATVDYWCDDSNFADYENSIINIINEANDDIDLVIKEHPAMYMKRDKMFYESLKRNKNLQIIHPYYNSNNIIEKINNVLVYTGSVGVESLIRNKRVFGVTNNYYSDLHPNFKKVNNISNIDLNYPIKEYDNLKFIEDLLKGMFKAKFVNNRNINKSDLNVIEEYVRSYIEN